MPVRVTPEQGAATWRDRLSGATDRINQGIDRVTVSPGEKAAASTDLWAQRTAAAKEKYQRNTRRVSLDQWKDKAKNIGVGRIADGAAKNIDKVQAFLSEFLPHLQRGVAQVEQMPKGNLEQSIQRSAAMIRHNASFKRSG